ncbi:MAG: aa3-type cytochrome c oxidase subunit IV [Hyphomonas sp.]|uniref:aa3-type cytochrome c oxidase subunit IV n=1 Tax=Hyphomonas sp. TaxID=87 RepID=UPI0017D3F313|nr:aa3-type cytochrome c oxidase subunit IV [Hyphomonas sp.]MBU3921190.1 aa3-type cytochrome c oxidase subunit IV [Alphaproteobacteria bacterium]MBA3070322.1 aa3-type cytochrome c oxidase subunit IV [Hyphomonas sp.]MBU4062808.1 aa3-type cytochrome c oxidase subunit IV [Alphaproteobacteria bacterium]MBU4163727.1 aa3-type cytochrome c oxidase subunit IV [Alphaproteobacteria bacterium]MBU4568181.1 aa3-type cytochrome c oxidase subunit IV [Alphaproteobacteria bacterium]
MATHEFHHGEMDIQDQKATWDGFLTGSVWGGLIIVLMIGHAVLSIAIGLDWTISLGIMAIVGFAAGLLLNLGGRWMATVVVLIGLALVVQAFIWLFGAVL